MPSKSNPTQPLDLLPLSFDRSNVVCCAALFCVPIYTYSPHSVHYTIENQLDRCLDSSNGLTRQLLRCNYWLAFIKIRSIHRMFLHTIDFSKCCTTYILFRIDLNSNNLGRYIFTISDPKLNTFNYLSIAARCIKRAINCGQKNNNDEGIANKHQKSIKLFK